MSLLILVFSACSGNSPLPAPEPDHLADAGDGTHHADGGADAGDAATHSDGRADAGGFPSPAEILEALGAKGVEGADPAAVAGYRRTFGFLDKNGDSVLTVEEYIESGHFEEEQARAIFAATDRDQDGVVTEDEYVGNRIITDEAKLIFGAMDGNRNGQLTRAEFIASKRIKDPKLGAAIFKALDTNNNGELVIPEYLRVWGKWARQ